MNSTLCMDGVCQNFYHPKQKAVSNGLLQAIKTCDLEKLETYIRQFRDNCDELILAAESVAKLVNSQELKITARRFWWKDRGLTRWAVVCELYIVRARRILLVATDEEFSSLVLAHRPATVGIVSADCPRLLMRQIGKVAAQPPLTSLPPLALKPMLSLAATT